MLQPSSLCSSHCPSGTVAGANGQWLEQSNAPAFFPKNDKSAILEIQKIKKSYFLKKYCTE